MTTTDLISAAKTLHDQILVLEQTTSGSGQNANFARAARLASAQAISKLALHQLWIEQYGGTPPLTPAPIRPPAPPAAPASTPSPTGRGQGEGPAAPATPAVAAPPIAAAK